jgi:hypothetical protein
MCMKDGIENLPSFKCGHYEILKISFEGHEYMESLNAENQKVLMGSRRNGMLSYRPSLSAGKLVRSEEQEWAKDMPESSHRIPKSWWHKRYEGMDEDGVPKQPEWRSCGSKVETHEDMVDVTSFGPENGTVKLASWKDIEELKNGIEEPCISIEIDEDGLEGLEAMHLQKSVKEQRLNVEVNKMLTQQVKKPAATIHKRHKRAMLRKLGRKTLRKWREGQRSLLGEYSRLQLLGALVPVAGAKKKKKTQAEKMRPRSVLRH